MWKAKIPLSLLGTFLGLTFLGVDYDPPLAWES
jgi:hypothetical protein